jgi:uncharacterized membrane protein YkvI
MELSYFLAQLLGGSLALVALAGIYRPGTVTNGINELNKYPLFTLCFGYLLILLGLAVVLSHNIWSNDWRVLITLFGWGALIKGFLFIAVPAKLVNVARHATKNKQRIRIMLACALVLGAILFYQGM